MNRKLSGRDSGKGDASSSLTVLQREAPWVTGSRKVLMLGRVQRREEAELMFLVLKLSLLQ